MKNALKSLGTLALCLCLCACLLPLSASADSAIDKVLCTTSTIPVAQMSAGDISSATSTNGCYIESYGWYDAASGAYIGGLFGTDGVRVSITLQAQEGWYFSENVQVYLNNSSAAYTLGEDGKTLTLVRDYAPELWLPSITKNPGSENVTEGELASFVASATVTSEYKWYLYNPDTGSSYPSDQLSTLFPGTSIGGDGAGKFNIRNVRPDMDGWQVYCIFSGPGGETYSSKATLNVRPLEPTPSPTPEPTPEPTPSPTPEPTATPEADEDEGKLPPDHAHSFPESWRQSEALHWRECDCGAKTGEGSHSFVWELQREASRRESGLSVGECSVCGYRVEKEIAYNNANNILRYILFGLGGLVALTIIVLVIDSIRAGRRRRRRRRRRR